MDERKMEIESEIRGLKQLLDASDYKALKHADGALTDEEYEATRVQRQGFRDQINALEAELAGLESEA